MGWADAPEVTAPKWQSAPTYGDASQAENARKVLEDLQRQGKISPAEAAALAQLQAASPANQTEIGQTGAAYRGMLKTGMFNARDEVATALGIDGAAINARDQAAEQAYPEAFNTGEMAGGGLSMMLPGMGWSKLASGLNMAGKVGVGGVLGGLFGGATGFMDGNGANGFTGEDLSNRLETAKLPAMVGAGAGVLAPLVGAGAGALTRLVANRARGAQGMSSRAVGAIRGPLEDAQSVQDVRAYLDSLGPGAMPADVPGPLQSQAMGLVAMQGRGGAAVARGVNQRAEGAGPRINAVMDQQITGPNAAFDQRRALATERTNVLGPEYEAALKAPGQLDITAVLSAMDPNAVGATRATQDMLLRNLGIELAPGKQPLNTFINAPKLHNLRSELSDSVAEAGQQGRGGYVAQVKPTLGAIDGVLDTVPGYADARTSYANNKAMERAIEDGQGALRGGRVTAASPEEFRAQFDKLSEAQKDAFRAGMRRDIAGLMGTAKNEAASAWQEFAKTWNEEKLRIALGADAEPIIRRLKAEKVFSETRGRVDSGSMTAARTAAQRSLEAADPAPATSSGILSLGLTDVVRKNVLDPAIFGPRRSRLNEDIGNFYASTGPEARAMIDAILAQTGNTKGKKASILAELLARSLTQGAGGAIAQSSNP